MPKNVHAVVQPPPIVDNAHQMVKSLTRLMLIHWLVRNPGVGVGEMVDYVGGQRHTLRAHLVALEEIGVIVPSHPAGARERERVTYSVDQARCRELLGVLAKFLT